MLGEHGPGIPTGALGLLGNSHSLNKALAFFPVLRLRQLCLLVLRNFSLLVKPD